MFLNRAWVFFSYEWISCQVRPCHSEHGEDYRERVRSSKDKKMILFEEKTVDNHSHPEEGIRNTDSIMPTEIWETQRIDGGLKGKGLTLTLFFIFLWFLSSIRF